MSAQKGHPSVYIARDGGVWRAEIWPTRLLCPAWLTRDANWIRLWMFLKRTRIVRLREVRSRPARINEAQE